MNEIDHVYCYLNKHTPRNKPAINTTEHERLYCCRRVAATVPAAASGTGTGAGAGAVGESEHLDAEVRHFGGGRMLAAPHLHHVHELDQGKRRARGKNVLRSPHKMVVRGSLSGPAGVVQRG